LQTVNKKANGDVDKSEGEAMEKGKRKRRRQIRQMS